MRKERRLRYVLIFIGTISHRTGCLSIQLLSSLFPRIATGIHTKNKKMLRRKYFKENQNKYYLQYPISFISVILQSSSFQKKVS